ncbi:MAG: cytidylyltransferase domain-containing protein [Phycisphaeraceae bacterium]
MNHHNTLAVVLARAGSKGLPSKNALPCAGKPMLAWTLEHALASRRVGRVVLSTDGPAIADIARSLSVEVINRPAELAHDTATVDAAARHAVETLEARRGHFFDAIAILYGNVPVRPADLTDRALAKLAATGCDSVQSLSPVGKHHPWWMKRLGGEDGDALKPYHPNGVYRRQDLPPVYALDGGVIAVTRESLFTVTPGEPHAFLGSDRRAVVCDHEGEVIDVDTTIDLKLAEAVLKEREAALREAG